MDIVERILLDEPDNPKAIFVACCVLRNAARYVQCIQFAKRLTELCPRDPKGWEMLSASWAELHRYDEGIRCAEKAYSLQPTGRTKMTLAFAVCCAGDYPRAHKLCSEALTECQRVLAGSPGEAERKTYESCLVDAKVNLAYCDMALGHWVEGFQGYRHTQRTKWRKERVYPAAGGGETVEWNGEPDATVIVTGEQGLGDEIMAAGMIPQAIARCRKFIFDCDERMGPLFARAFPQAMVLAQRRREQLVFPAGAALPTHHKTLFGLAELLRRSDADFPRQPYLKPRADYVAMFKELFGGKPVIGLAWSGGLPRTGMEPRMAGLRSFLPLLRRGGAEFVSLQYKEDLPEIAEFHRETGILVRRVPWATMKGDAQDIDLLAALVAACDEVVGVHTTALHIAAALGTPTTMLTHRGSGWRYARPELLWYPPTTRLWRKRTGESWRDCVSRLVEERKEKLAA